MKYIHFVEGLVLVITISFSQSSLYAAPSTTYAVTEPEPPEPMSVVESIENENKDFAIILKSEIKKEEEKVKVDEAVGIKTDNIKKVEVDETGAIHQEINLEESVTNDSVYKVPFYSQFTDISSAEWRKVGCGIASVAMIIDYYSQEDVLVDDLLKKGIAAGAFSSDVGWTHQGLINLSKPYGLKGLSREMSALSMQDAFSELEKVLAKGPVMVSVHYTFDPKNPIPHLVVIDGIKDGKVFYNDPAEAEGGGSISITKFQSSWKKRYIEISPA